MSADSIIPDPTNPQSFNRYSYTYNNPIRYTDPTGHCIFELPCPEAVDNALDTVNDFLLGVEAEFVYNNTFGLNTNLEPSPSESTPMLIGRVVGDVITTVQGAFEMSGGATMMGGGVAICATGVGCLAAPAVEVAGAGVVAHGYAVSAQAIDQLVENGSILFSELTSGGSGDGNDPVGNLRYRKERWLENQGLSPHEMKDGVPGRVSEFDIYQDDEGYFFALRKGVPIGQQEPFPIGHIDEWLP